MRLIRSGKTELRIRASNLARIYFVQEFGVELDKFMIDELKPDNAPENLAQALFKIVWSMWKADVYYMKQPTLDYRAWLVWLATAGESKTVRGWGATTTAVFDISDCVNDIMDEIEYGFTVKRTYGKNDTDSAKGGNLAHRIVAVALKMGMSLDELNELTTQALIDIMHEYVKSGKEDENTVRIATPKEAYAYFRGRR